MKKLPIGKQDFASLINENCIYVDKTELLYKLTNKGFYYFISRPHRFGKSLTISTLKEIFSGNNEIFKRAEKRRDEIVKYFIHIQGIIKRFCLFSLTRIHFKAG